ncbi:M16 family metallopeptidase [Porphyromonas pogonae]|uniref:M16 family metallopeptidase n=1 Tax=Porphyromonas pogonae TaxID=867595 RepID=UPI002E780C9B|nr:insulinase family protein [Porphyromonas pogonae]
MNFTNRIFTSLLKTLLLLPFVQMGSYAQHSPVEIDHTLPNGLRYIIRKNAAPTRKAEFRLIYRIGSCIEQDNERGYAHFLEHLAFGGTQHFPDNKLVDYIESLGVRYGVGLNAFTGYDRTVYMMSLPLDNVGVIDSAILIMSDWLSCISLDNHSIDREKGVVKEEIRTYEEYDPFYKLKLGNGIHARRLPLGCMADIDRIERVSLLRFYRKWYIPSLATILIVGDVEPADVEAKIKKQLSAISPSEIPANFCLFPLTYAPGVKLSICKDSLLSTATLDVMVPHPCSKSRSINEITQCAVRRMAVAALQTRANSLGNIKVKDNWYLGETDHFSVNISGKGGNDILKKLKGVMSYLSSLVHLTSIDSLEMTDLKQEVKDVYYPLDGNMSSGEWCDYYTDHVLMQDMLLKSEDSVTKLHQQIDKIQFADLKTEWLQMVQWLRSSVIAGYTANTERKEFACITEDLISKAIDRGLSTPASPFAYKRRALEKADDSIVSVNTPPAQLLKVKETKSPSIKSRVFHDKIGVTEVILVNGIKLILKPFPNAADSVVKVAIAVPGGYSAIPDSARRFLEGVAGYMELGLIEGIDRNKLQSYMMQHNVSLALTPSSFWDGMMATAPTSQLLPLMNLLKHKMTKPERCHTDFEDIRTDKLEEVGKPKMLMRMLDRNPEQRMEKFIDSMMNSGPSIKEPSTAEDIRKMNLDSMADYHCDVFSRTEGMTFVVTGTFNTDEVIDIANRVFGTLPYKPALEIAKTSMLDTPCKEYIIDNCDTKDQSTIYNIYYGSYKPGLRSALRLKIMRELIRNRMIKHLRARTGIVYSPYIFLHYRAFPIPHVHFTLETSVKCSNVARANTLIIDLMNDLCTQDAGSKELADIKRSFLVNKREALTASDVASWQNTLLLLIKEKESLKDFNQYDEILESITAQEIRQAFASFINESNHVTYYIGRKQ